jgi:hypothetical protein
MANSATAASLVVDRLIFVLLSPGGPRRDRGTTAFPMANAGGASLLQTDDGILTEFAN